MVATSTTQPGPPTGPPTAFDALLERLGTGGLLRFVGALLALTALHMLVRLPALVVLRMVGALMARISEAAAAPAAAGFPGQPAHAAYGGGPA